MIATGVFLTSEQPEVWAGSIRAIDHGIGFYAIAKIGLFADMVIKPHDATIVLVSGMYRWAGFKCKSTVAMTQVAGDISGLETRSGYTGTRRLPHPCEAAFLRPCIATWFTRVDDNMKMDHAIVDEILRLYPDDAVLTWFPSTGNEPKLQMYSYPEYGVMNVGGRNAQNH